MADDIHLEVDGREITLAAEADESLLRALRAHGLTATTGACEQGECGSCSVLLDGRLECSCLVPAMVCEGARVATVEGQVGRDLGEALAANGAVQCGFCTPGFVVAAEAALDHDGPPLSVEQVRESLAGNLCRCTGYEGLIRAVCETDRARRGIA
ncbi:MAG: (2Fe-2S)-binding protein [Acidimicrobiaceae bacterium]|nr:(2Fe-2S)-binding protein [Acidimicrobiaceae bacterium]MBJ32306.1 (2Fe-2S)-binding protein [Acidimicrobiaceae bacterium]